MKKIVNNRYLEADFHKSPNTSGTIKQHNIFNSRTPLRGQWSRREWV